MTEEEWLDSSDYQRMLELRSDTFSRRRALLLCCVVVRIALPRSSNPEISQALVIMERIADDTESDAALQPYLSSFEQYIASMSSDHLDDEYSFRAGFLNFVHAVPNWRIPFVASNWLLGIDEATVILPPSIRDIFGNPFRPVTFDPRWRTSDVVGLAQAIYDERAFERMPILADALMDAGCEDEQIIGHCRGDGPHVRGCWVVDSVLGKE